MDHYSTSAEVSSLYRWIYMNLRRCWCNLCISPKCFNTFVTWKVIKRYKNIGIDVIRANRAWESAISFLHVTSVTQTPDGRFVKVTKTDLFWLDECGAGFVLKGVKVSHLEPQAQDVGSGHVEYFKQHRYSHFWAEVTLNLYLFTIYRAHKGNVYTKLDRMNYVIKSFSVYFSITKWYYKMISLSFGSLNHR